MNSALKMLIILGGLCIVMLLLSVVSVAFDNAWLASGAGILGGVLSGHADREYLRWRLSKA